MLIIDVASRRISHSRSIRTCGTLPVISSVSPSTSFTTAAAPMSSGGSAGPAPSSTGGLHVMKTLDAQLEKQGPLVGQS